MLLPLLLLNACAPTYPGGNLTQSVEELCRKEYGFEAEARLTGRTLYVSCELDSFQEGSLSIQDSTLQKIEGAMLSGTRVVLSTDGNVDFFVVRARDPLLGVHITLIRYIPDIKGLIYFRISHDDFQNRLLSETQFTPQKKDDSKEDTTPEEQDFHDITLPEFQARLVASRLHQQFAANPLVSAFMQISRVNGSYADGILRVELVRFGESASGSSLVKKMLRMAVRQVAGYVIKAYDNEKVIQEILVEDSDGEMILKMTPDQLTEPDDGLDNLTQKEESVDVPPIP